MRSTAPFATETMSTPWTMASSGPRCIICSTPRDNATVIAFRGTDTCTRLCLSTLEYPCNSNRGCGSPPVLANGWRGCADADRADHDRAAGRRAVAGLTAHTRRVAADAHRAGGTSDVTCGTCAAKCSPGSRARSACLGEGCVRGRSEPSADVGTDASRRHPFLSCLNREAVYDSFLSQQESGLRRWQL